MCATMLAGMARELDCEIDLAAAGPAAGDRRRDELVQVVQNLVENALKYGSSGKRVEIERRTVERPHAN